MIDAYEAMYRRLVSDRAIAERIRNKFRFMPQPVYGGEYSASQRFGIVWRLLVRGVLRGGPSRLWHFLRSLPLTSPRKLPLVMVDWIAGLSMRDYVDRHFPVELVNAGRVEKLFARMQRLKSVRLAQTRVALTLRRLAVPDLSIRLRGGLPRAFFSEIGRRLDKLMCRTRSTLTLRIEGLREHELPDLNRLLARLARYGDRVSIVLDERVRKLVRVDSSVFHIVLEPNAAATA
jgi:hypothetical protein